MSFSQFIPVLQTAIGPMILISGVGLILLTLTNRLGRAIDRSRILAAACDDASVDRRESIQEQLDILWKRARLLRASIISLILSALNAALMIVAIFLSALFNFESTMVICVLFVLCMGCLIGSLLAFAADVNASLAALKREMQAHRMSLSQRMNPVDKIRE